MKWFIFLLFIVCNSFAASANTQSPLETIKVDKWVLGATIGYGQIKSHLTDEDDISLYIIPDIRYFSERFYIENTNVGYSMYESSTYSIEIIGRFNLDGIYFPSKYRDVIASYISQSSTGLLPFESTDVPTELILYPEKKSLSYMGGMVFRYYNEYTNVNLSLTKDISAGHHGLEAQAKVVQNYLVDDLAVEIQFAVDYKSDKLVNYYYGIDESNVPLFHPQLLYDPSDVINWHTQVQLGYPLTESWWLVSSFRYEWLDSKIVKSPIVKSDNIFSYYAGFKRLF